MNANAQRTKEGLTAAAARAYIHHAPSSGRVDQYCYSRDRHVSFQLGPWSRKKLTFIFRHGQQACQVYKPGYRKQGFGVRVLV